MSHVPTVLKSDRSVFDKMLPVDDNAFWAAQMCVHFMKVLTVYTLTSHVLTLPLKRISQKVICFCCLLKHFSLFNSVDPDQAAPIGAV